MTGSHLANFRGHLNELLCETEKAQAAKELLKQEYLQIKAQEMSERKANLFACFDHSSEVMWRKCFASWKHETATAKQERTKAWVHAEKAQMKAEYDELKRQLQADRDNALSQERAQMDEERKHLRCELEKRDKALAAARKEIITKTQDFEILQTKLGKMDKFLVGLAESSATVRDLGISARDELGTEDAHGQARFEVVSMRDDIQDSQDCDAFIRESMRKLLQGNDRTF